MTRSIAWLCGIALLTANTAVVAQTGVEPQPDPGYQIPGYQTPQYTSPPWQQDMTPSQVYQNRKAQEARGTPYGTINGEEYRPRPDDYYTRSRVLHPQVVRGWGYDPNAANYGPDYSAGILPVDYPLPDKSSNVTFRLPGYGSRYGNVYPSAPPVVMPSYYAASSHATAASPAGFCLRRGRGRAFTLICPAGYPVSPTATGAYSYYHYGPEWYLASYNYPNEASHAIVPVAQDPYNFHFGPGLHRGGVSGHYRFPYYSYRRPWYYPGDASFQRNTQFPW